MSDKVPKNSQKFKPVNINNDDNSNRLGLLDWALSRFSFSFLSSSTFLNEAIFSCSIWETPKSTDHTAGKHCIQLNNHRLQLNPEIRCCRSIMWHRGDEEAHLSLSDFLLLLLQEGRGDAGDVFLGAQQQGPQVFHELSGILSIQEPCQVDLHHLAVWMLQHTDMKRGKEKKNTAVEISENKILKGGRIPQMGSPAFYPSLD